MPWLEVPHLQQTEPGWCLPACIATVAAYWQQPLLQADVAEWLGARDNRQALYLQQQRGRIYPP